MIGMKRTGLEIDILSLSFTCTFENKLILSAKSFKIATLEKLLQLSKYFSSKISNPDFTHLQCMPSLPVHYILFILLATTACKLQFLRNAKRFQHQQKHTQTPIIIQKIKTCQFLLHYCTFCNLLKVWIYEWKKKECNDLALLVENGSGTSFDLLLTEE